MTQESQNIEWKSSWHDDYLKWVAGFANAHGGTLYIGKDDRGAVVGIDNASGLLEILPDKIRNLMGIMPEVNLLTDDGKNYLEIKVPPYNVPISLRGRFYYRSGATKQELTGAALNDFMLRRVGKSWDDVIEPSATLDNLDERSISSYRHDAAKAARLPEDVLDLDIPQLLQKLRLMEHDGSLKRAAIVLFGKEGALYPNMPVKIGRFKTDSDLRYQEFEEGNLLTLLREVPAQLNRKFFVKPIDFAGLQRIERGEYPVAALREILLNALVHRDYNGTLIQVRVYDTMFSIWNEGFLPEGLTLEALRRQHPSRPRNPLLADVCFKGGYIDAWGRGTLKVFESCRMAGLPEPELKEEDGGMMVKLFKTRIVPSQTGKLRLNDRQIAAVKMAEQNGRITSKEYEKAFEISSSVARAELSKLVAKNILQRIGTRGPSVHYIII